LYQRWSNLEAAKSKSKQRNEPAINNWTNLSQLLVYVETYYLRMGIIKLNTMKFNERCKQERTKKEIFSQNQHIYKKNKIDKTIAIN